MVSLKYSNPRRSVCSPEDHVASTQDAWPLSTAQIAASKYFPRGAQVFEENRIYADAVGQGFCIWESHGGVESVFCFPGLTDLP